MVMIPQVNDSVLPQGHVEIMRRAQAKAEDFGGQVAQAQERFSGDVAQGAEAVNAVDQNNGRLWAYNAASQAYTGLSKSFNEQVNSLDPNDPEFSQKVSGLSDTFHSQIQQASDDAMAAAPTEFARKIVASHMAMNGHALMQHAMGEQARLTGVYVGKTVEDAAKSNQDSLASDPSNDNYDRIKAGMQATIGGLNNVDPTLKMKWQDNSEHSMAITQVGVLAATDPVGFLRGVHAQGGLTTGKGAVPGGAPDTPAAPDYDMAGYVAKYGQPDQSNGQHLTDEFKLPNHMTFSTDSIYSTPEKQGGSWTQEGGKWHFYASPFNLQQHSPKEMQDYFKRVEPDSVLHLPTEGIFSRIIQQESGGNQGAVSPKGAVGVAQIMPDTGPEAAALAGVAWDPDKFKNDAAYNAQLGNAYFQKQLATNNGNVSKALAAYNMGPSALAATVAKYRDSWLQHVPAETQNYVATIMAQGPAPAAPTVPAASALVAQPPDVPQVQPLTDQQIGQAAPGIHGWGKLTWPEKVAAVRQAEAAMGAGLAGDRGKMDVVLRDMSASFMAGKGYASAAGTPPPDVSLGNLQRLYGVDGGQRKFDDLAKVRDVGGAISQLATMTDAQIQSTINRQDVAGGPGFADQNPVAQAFIKAAAAVTQARNVDFPQFAIDNGIGGAKPIDFSTAQNFQIGILNRLPLAISGRNDYGAPAAHLLTKDEASGLGDLLNRMNPQDQMAYVKGLSTALTNHPGWSADVWHQVAPKNAMLPIAAGISANRGTVPTAAGAQTGDIVGQYVLEGNHILMGGAPDGDGTKTGRAMNLDDKTFHTMFSQAVGPNAFSSPDAQRSAQVADDTYQAVKSYLAADIYKRGIDPKVLAPKDVENAITAVTGGTMQTHGGTLFLPWGMDKNTFSQKFNVASRAAMDRAGLTGSAMDTPDAFQYANWGEGKYLITMGGRALQGNDGRPVIVDINNLAPGVHARPSVQLLK